MLGWRALRSRLLSILFISSALASLWIFIAGWLRIATIEGIVAILVLAVLVLMGVVLLAWQEYRFSRKARYAEALPSLREFARAMSSRPLDSADKCLMGLQDAIREVSEAFTLITGTRIGVCLKKVVLVTAVNRCKVEDVCRDPKSKERGERQRTRDGRMADHWIDVNTAFRSTWIEGGRPAGAQYYLCNNLPAAPHYYNTSFEIYGEPASATSWLGYLNRGRHWPLPYKSTVVVPVLGPRVEQGSSVVLGYIALDSASVNVFDARYDVPFLRIFAEFLAPVVDKYLQHELKSAGSSTHHRSSH